MYAGVPIDDPGAGEALVVSGQPAGDTEVGHQRVAIGGEEQVLRLDVAVDHAMVVGVLEGLGRFAGDAHRVLDRKLPLARQPVAQRFALYKGHGEPELAGGFAGVMDRENVRMLQAGGGLDLALEAVGAERLGQFGMEHLEGHRPFVPEVVGQVDRGHAPAPEFALEAVAISQGISELSREIGHSRFRQGEPVRYRPEMRRARLRRTCPGP